MSLIPLDRSTFAGTLRNIVACQMVISPVHVHVVKATCICVCMCVHVCVCDVSFIYAGQNFGFNELQIAFVARETLQVLYVSLTHCL